MDRLNTNHKYVLQKYWFNLQKISGSKPLTTANGHLHELQLHEEAEDCVWSMFHDIVKRLFLQNKLTRWYLWIFSHEIKHFAQVPMLW